MDVGVTTLCVQNIPFPNKAVERRSLTNLKRIFLVELNSTLKLFQTETELVKLHIQQLPQASDADIDNIIELNKVDQTAIEIDIHRLTNLSTEISLALGPGGINSELDILVLSQKHSNLMAGVARLTKVTSIPFFATALMLDSPDKTALNPEKEIRVSKINTIQYLIEMIDKQEPIPNLQNETVQKGDPVYHPDFWDSVNNTKNDTQSYTEYGRYLFDQGYSMAMWGKYLLWSLFSFSSWDVILFCLTIINLAANVLALFWIKKLRKIKYLPIQVRQMRQVRFDRDRSFSEGHTTPLRRFVTNSRKLNSPEEIMETREAKVGRDTKSNQKRTPKGLKVKKLKRLAPPPPYSAKKVRKIQSPYDYDDIRTVGEEDWGNIPLHRLPLSDSMLSL